MEWQEQVAGQARSVGDMYDRVSGQWYAYQPVSVSPAHQPIGDKRAYVDLGVRVPVMAYVEGDAETFGYSGNSLLSDWWYWTNKISECQSELKKVNGKHKPKRLSKLYRKRRNRFRHQVNCIVKDFVERCYSKVVSEVVLERIEEKAEEHGIRVTQVNERGTSSQCPKCGSTNIVRRGRLFKCKSCGLEAHRDAVDSVNIGLAHSGGEVINGAVACPLLSEAEPHTLVSQLS